jgi:adenylate cyclase
LKKRVRITAQLNDVISGHHLWAERYDRDLKDIFALQDEITMKIITELQVELTEGEEARLLAKGTGNIEAYLRSLKGHRYLMRHNTDDYVRARQMFEEAIELDPEYATAYASLALVYLYAGSGLGKSVVENEKQAHKQLQKALTIDETDYRARLQLGIQYQYDRQYEKAIAELKKYIELYPSSPAGHAELGITLIKCGKPEEAILHLKKVLRLLPIMDRLPIPLGVAYRDMGRYGEAIQVFKEYAYPVSAGVAFSFSALG